MGGRYSVVLADEERTCHYAHVKRTFLRYPPLRIWMMSEITLLKLLNFVISRNICCRDDTGMRMRPGSGLETGYDGVTYKYSWTTRLKSR